MVPPRHMGVVMGFTDYVFELLKKCAPLATRKNVNGRQSMGFKAWKQTEPLFMGSLGNPD